MTLIANRYQLGKELGQGGMGTVYKGVDIQTKNPVAIKLLNADVLKNDTEMLERFRREGRALRDLNHPNIVKMLDAIQEDDKNYLILEYISGGDLRNLLEPDTEAPTALPVSKVLRLALQLADALTRAHYLDIIHRDLKPANVLLAEDGTIRLTDFGVARIASEARVTGTQNIIGTLDYLPPEALQNKGIDARADIWAFGVMLFEMLAGQRPFVGDDLGAVVTAIILNPLPDLEELRPDAPIALVDLIYRMLEKDPQARISSVRHVGAALEDILKGRDTSSTSVSSVVQVVQQVNFDTPTPEAIVRPKHNLPQQTTAFVGREAEVSELTRLLDQPAGRLVTILGPGGMGKTRLALEVASHYANVPNVGTHHATPLPENNQFPDGVYIVELAPLSDPNSIIATVADATQYKFQEDGRDQKQQLLDYLNPKKMLLIMDNYEHIMDGAGRVTDILQGTTHLKIIATSRQKLNQTGETVFNLEGMDFPQWETPEDALEYAAVKLFMQSARRARPDFELGAGDLPHVARISRLVRGMPLGILLAASWLAMLDPKEISDEIQQGMDFLESDMGDLPDRHRSIRAVFDYSWNLMTEQERDTFARLSIFKGGFTREAAQAVANANLRTLMSLMNKSLIRRDADSGRYEVHELLRQYGEEQLRTSGSEPEVKAAHSAHYAQLLTELEPKLKGHGQVPTLNAITDDFENIRLAWETAVEAKDGANINQMLEALFWYCTFRSRFQEGQELFKQARQVFPATSDQADLVAGRLSVRLPEPVDDPLPIYERALAIAQHHNDELERAWCMRQIGHHLSHNYVDTPKGNRTMEESLTLFEQLGDEFRAAIVLDDLSWGYMVEGVPDRRAATLQQCIETRKRIGDEIGLANAYRNLGGARLTEGDMAGAEQAWLEGERMALRLGDRVNLAWCNILLIVPKIGETLPPMDYPRIVTALEIANDIGIQIILRVGQVYKGLLTALQGNYQEALQLTQQVYTHDEQPTVTMAYYGEWAYVVIGVGLEDYELTRRALKRAYSVLLPENSGAQLALPGAVCLLAHEGQEDLAAELLGVLSIIPNMRWSDEWPPLLQTRAELQKQLGEAAYNAAYERGRQQNPVDAIQKLRDLTVEDS